MRHFLHFHSAHVTKVAQDHTYNITANATASSASKMPERTHVLRRPFLVSVLTCLCPCRGRHGGSLVRSEVIKAAFLHFCIVSPLSLDWIKNAKSGRIRCWRGNWAWIHWLICFSHSAFQALPCSSLSKLLQEAKIVVSTFHRSQSHYH